MHTRTPLNYIISHNREWFRNSCMMFKIVLKINLGLTERRMNHSPAMLYRRIHLLSATPVHCNKIEVKLVSFITVCTVEKNYSNSPAFLIPFSPQHSYWKTTKKDNKKYSYLYLFNQIICIQFYFTNADDED